MPSDPRSWALMTEQGHPGLQGPAIQSRRHSCDASNQGVCVFVLGQTAGREPGRGGCLVRLGTPHRGRAVLGPGCCGHLSLKYKQNQEKALSDYFPPSSLSVSDWICWFMKFCNR